MKKALGWNPGKVCFGISRIGYSAASAICDILDNSVSNGAKKCWIQINKKEDSFGDAKAENIKEILIIDDGNGMDESGLIKALDLGSSDENYVDGTLSKFGLGLKSASYTIWNRSENSVYSRTILKLVSAALTHIYRNSRMLE